jgi:hypothetical protein
MEGWIQQAIDNWQLHKVKMNPPATISEIEHTESVLNFIFPEDFKQFYLVINGFDALDWQEHMFTFWPLKMMIEEYNENEQGFIGFSDFLLKINSIGFSRHANGVFKLYSSIENNIPEYIASSFQQVVHMINSSNDLIY